MSTPGPHPATEPASALWSPVALRRVALACILALSAFLNTRDLSRNGFANTYYAAAVKSMLRSAHNFVFVSFDPQGLVSLDKTPLSPWLQTFSAKLFGFTPLALLLPQAIAGVLAVAVIYLLVARQFGAIAGLLSALALATFPAFVAVARDNNPDALLILLMLLACAAGIRAAESGSLRWLLGAAVLAALAFNTKELAATLMIPGMALGYLVCAPKPPLRRLAELALAAVVLLALSLSWIAFVQATPAAQRPYVGDSSDNSEFNTAFSYNGVGRVGGQVGGPEQTEGLAPARTLHQPDARATRRHVLVAFGGPTGPLRLLDSELGDQGGWLLGFAVGGALAIALVAGRRRRRDGRLIVLLVMGTWLLAEVIVLSFGKGIIHPYYVSAVGPGAAAMTGAGAVCIAELARRRGWRLAVAVAPLLLTALVQTALLHKDGYAPWVVPVVIAACAAAAVVLLVRPRWATAAVASAVVAASIAPAAIAATTADFPVEGTFPAAGPTASAGPGGIGVNAGGLRANRRLLAWAGAHHPGTRFAILTDSTVVAAPMILLGGRVAAAGGYNGTDPALDAQTLAQLVRSGQARFMLMGGVYWGRGGNEATQAIVAACRPISLGPILSGTHPRRGTPVAPPTSISFTLYDCRGRAPAILAWAAARGHGTE